MTKDAFIAYDGDGVLKCVLGDMWRRLKELGARRVKAKKDYYWMLKPDEVVEV